MLAAAAAAVTGLARATAGATRTQDRVVELRQYTCFGGRRDALIALFEREFVESQEAAGAHVVGTFRDLDDPDRFVWLRGFASMDARRRALTAFYTGPAWRAHHDAANATMLDSGNVLLLRPAARGDLGALPRGPDGPAGVIAARIYTLAGADPAAFGAFFDAALRPRLEDAGAAPLATLVSETTANDVPRLPVREGESVFAWFARFPDERAERAAAVRLDGLSGWRDGAPEALLPALMRKPEVLRLTPTARSKLR